MSASTLPGPGEAGDANGGDGTALARLPSVDRLLQHPLLAQAVAQHGQPVAKRAVQQALDAARQRVRAGAAIADHDALAAEACRGVTAASAPRLTPVFNLTGTVIHTNLGRALLADEAIAAVAAAMRGYGALEYDLARGERGDRDRLVEDLFAQITGAPAVTVVNNCAAAVVLALKALAARKEVLISRGELIEIGGAFRMPEIMRAAGCKLVEVGTTNRTHAHDFAAAIGPRTGLVLKAHASNYAVTGFTAAVEDAELARIAHAAGVPFVVDLGSGALVDLARFGLPREPLPQDALAAGADLVMFSGDKLLGGPQAGILLGRADLIERIRKDPLKRALRVSKLTLAALEATLRIYASEHRLAERLPTLQLLTRPRAVIAAAAARLREPVAQFAGADFDVEVADCASQIGSGAQPVERLPSAALRIAHRAGARGTALRRLETRLRALSTPVLGRVHDGALWLDLRCLREHEEAGLVANLAGRAG